MRSCERVTLGMASNNLAAGAKALLAAGADPAHAGQARASALQMIHSRL